MKIQRLPESELLIMKVLWRNREAISSNEIYETLKSERDWKLTTVNTLLSRLVDKKFVSFQKNGRAYVYETLIPEKEYLEAETSTFLSLLHGGSLRSLVASLYDGKGIDQKDIEDLKRWLDEKEREDV